MEALPRTWATGLLPRQSAPLAEGLRQRGDVHTNTIEGFWSLVKRGINGVYHVVSAKYLQSYLNEYAFRYNHRQDEVPMFQTMLAQVEKA